MAKSKGEIPVWKSINEYYDFTKKYNVYGGEAIKLKKQLDKQSYIPQPKVK